jgi:hypothetical protein
MMCATMHYRVNRVYRFITNIRFYTRQRLCIRVITTHNGQHVSKNTQSWCKKDLFYHRFFSVFGYIKVHTKVNVMLLPFCCIVLR